MWVRGLKHGCARCNETGWQVAPHVGAWIETRSPTSMQGNLQVAPHVGAWIETLRALLP